MLSYVLRILRSFELKWTIFDVVECNSAHLKVLRSSRVRETNLRLVTVFIHI